MPDDRTEARGAMRDRILSHVRAQYGYDVRCGALVDAILAMPVRDYLAARGLLGAWRIAKATLATSAKCDWCGASSADALATMRAAEAGRIPDADFADAARKDMNCPLPEYSTSTNESPDAPECHARNGGEAGEGENP